MTQLTNAMSSGHILFPHYGFRLNTVDGKIQYQSVPLSNEAAKEYPPSVKCIGTVQWERNIINLRQIRKNYNIIKNKNKVLNYYFNRLNNLVFLFV